MKTRFSLFLFVFVVAAIFTTPARAQLGISIRSSRTKFLRYEPVEIILKVHNYSGNPLSFSDSGVNRGHLFFTVDNHANYGVKCLDKDANPIVGLSLDADETKELRIQLNDIFDLQRTGTYSLTAQIGHAMLDSDYQSERLTFEVRSGRPIIVRKVGLPLGDTVGRIKALTVTLLEFNDDRKSMYCLQVEDKQRVYATIRLGPQISSVEPQMDADGGSDIHVFFQVGGRLYTYVVYSLTNCNVRLRQQRYYVPGDGVPFLSRATGYLKVLNGKTAIEGQDYELEDADKKGNPGLAPVIPRAAKGARR